LSIEKAKEKLGWSPEYDLEKGVAITAQFYKNQQ
jgi:nucleoside-diphosphate-sugar epimerase